MDIKKNFDTLLFEFTFGVNFNDYEDDVDFLHDFNCKSLDDFVQDEPTLYAYFYDVFDFFNNRGVNPIDMINQFIKDYFNKNKSI